MFQQVDQSATVQLGWIDDVDALLARAELVIGMTRADVAPIADRLALWVDIVALRNDLDAERQRLTRGTAL
jgi:hypothetical protein